MRLFGVHTREVAERIVDAFRHPESLPKALAPIFIHRNDDVPCRRWSWHNQLLVALCGSVDARGMRQWNKVGRSVKKGSAAIWILAPCIKTIREQQADGEESCRQILYGFRSVPVFAVEDTEGNALPQGDDRYDTWTNELPLIEVAKAWDINVGTYSHEGAAPLGYYRYSGNGNQAVMLGVENLSTWCHELVHAADHRLTNLNGDKWRKEIVAELGSAILLTCQGLDYDADLGGAYEYIQRYALEVKVSPVKVCIEVLDSTCRCVQLILDTAGQLKQTAVPA